MDNVACGMVWDALMKDRRDGKWLLYATISDGHVEATIEWSIDEGAKAPTAEGPVVTEETLAGSLSFPSLASYSDFKTFWRQAGGEVDEQK